MTTLSDFIKNLKDKPFLVLDTETTGLDDGEIVQIAIIDNYGTPLLDTFVKPARPIPADATRIHGITYDMCAYSPHWPDLVPKIREILEGKLLVVYNAVYDRKMMYKSQERHLNPKIEWKEICQWFCAMEAYAEFYGDWNDYRGSYTWQPLIKAHRLTTHKDHPTAHSALGDCLATLEVTKFLIYRGIEVLPPPVDSADMMGEP